MTSETDRHALQTEERIKQALEANSENLEKYFQFLKLANTGKLIGDISHTLNNILGGILGYSQLLKCELEQTSHGYRHAELIEQATKRASKLVSQLQSLADKRVSRKNFIEPKMIVEQVVALLGNTSKRSIQITTSYLHGKAKIYADVSSLTQALLNICTNAVEAMPRGGELAISTQVRSGKERSVIFTVSDTGPGIAREDLPHVFQPFFTTKNLSCGMGLPLAEALVKYQQGTIEVKSEYGTGAQFKVFLPVADASNLTPDLFKRRDEELNNGAEKYILIIDDEAELREMAKKIFEKKGFRVLLAENGESAIRIFKQNSHKIRLVILDMVLPGIDGAEVYKNLKELCAELKIILTSGYIKNTAFEQILAAGDEVFLPKPWDLPELINEAEKILHLTKNPSTNH